MPVLGQTPVRTHWEDSESITVEKIGAPYTDPNDSTKLVQDVKSHRIAQGEIRASSSGTIDDTSLPAIIFNDASPATSIAISLDSSVDDGFVRDLLNESTHTITLTPSSGDINAGSGAGSSATLAPGTSCTLLKISSGSPATANWKMFKGAGFNVWGSITGTLSAQTDLQSALDSLSFGELGVEIDGGGSVPSTGSKGYLRVPYDCTIVDWTIFAKAVGSCQITVKKSNYAGFPTTASIVAAAPPTLTGTRKATSSTLTGWTVGLSRGDILEFNLDSVATLQWIQLVLTVSRG